MSSGYHKECDTKLIDRKAKECSDCVAPPGETKNISVKEMVRFLGFLLVIIIILAFAGKIVDVSERESQQEDRKEKEDTALVLNKEFIYNQTSVPDTKKPEDAFLETIEIHYLELVALLDENKRDKASRKLDLFQKYNKMDYKNVGDIKKDIEISELEEKAKSIPVSRVTDNLYIYKQLVALEPNNPKYKKKVSFYKAKLEAIEKKKKKDKPFVIIDKASSAPVLSFPIKGSLLGNIPAGKKVQILEEQLIKNGMTSQIWYRVKINSSYGWISKDVTTGGIVKESKNTAKRR